MAFATKYRIEGTSDVYGKITVNIKLDGYTGSVISLDAVGRNWIELKIGDNSNDISNPILPGTITFSFYVLSDFQTTEIGRSQANTYYVEVLDSSSNQIWVGWALPEQYNESYHNTPYVATVVASDGLDELKSKPYIIQSGKVILLDHIINCLNETGLALPIYESINIYSNGMVSTNADSALKQARVTYNSFLDISEKPDSYAVLGSILQPFFARIYQYRGWRIENILEKRSSYVVRQFSSAGIYVGNSTFNPLVKFDTDYADFRAFIQKSGQLSIKPALNNAEVYFNTVEPIGETTTNGFSTNADWTSTTDLVAWDITAGVSQPITIEQVIANWSGNQYAVKIAGKVDSFQQSVNYLESNAYPVQSADFQTINLSFAYWADYPSIIIVGSKPILYFQVIFTETGTGATYYYANEWSLESTAPLKNRIDFSNRKEWRTYSMSIDRVPGNGTIKFRFYKLVKSGTTGVTELRLTGWNTNLIIQQPANDSLLLEGATTATTTTYKGPSFAHIISDGIILNAAGVMDVSNTLTATWARRGVTESLNIRRLYLLQWLSFNSNPTEILTGTIHQKGEVITPMSVVKDDDLVSSVRYLMQNFTFNLGTGFGSANYRELITTDAVLSYFEEYLNQPRTEDYFPAGFNPLFIPGAPGTSPNASPGQIIIPNLSGLNGDVKGAIGQTEITPAAIVNKARLDITSLTDDEIVFGAVKDDPSQENMTNLRLSDIKSRIGIIPTAAVIGRYDIDTSGTTAPVGTKDIRYNNATQISATQLFISDITEDGIDVDLFLSLIKQGSALVIQDRDDHLNYQTYEVSGTPTFASATWTFPVTFKDSGGTGTTNFANNHKMLLSALSSGSGTIGGSIASGQVAYGSGTNQIQGSALFTYNGNLLSVINETTTASRGISIQQYSSDVASAQMNFFKSRGSIASPTNVSTGDAIGAFNFRARIGGAFSNDRSLFGSVMTSTTGQSMFFISGTTNSNYTPNLLFDESGGVGIGLGGSIITTVNRPTGRLDVRGFGTTTGITLLLEDSTGANNFEFLDNGNISIPSTNGAKIGTATSQKLAFWNATPIVQPTTGVAESAFVENAGGTAVNDDSTFDGYTLRQVVKALRNAGLLA